MMKVIPHSICVFDLHSTEYEELDFIIDSIGIKFINVILISGVKEPCPRMACAGSALLVIRSS